MADDVKNLLLRFTGESQDAKDDIETVIALLVEAGAIDAEAKIGIDGTVKVKSELTEVFAILAALDNSKATVEVDVNTQKLSLGTRLLQAFGLSTGTADKGLEEFSSGISRLNINLPGFLGRLNAVSGAAFAAALAIGVTLVGAIGALVASLAAALAGLASLAAAFGAALGPAILLVIGVVQRLAAVWKVLKQEDQAQLQAEQSRIQGNQQVVAALEQRHQAYIALRRAAAEVGAAESSALREVEDAATRATDAILGLARAQLSEQDAALGIKEAEFELKKFIADMKVGQKEASAMFKKFTDVSFDPSKLNKALAKVKTPGVSGLDKQEQELKLERLILNIKDARLREKEATNSVTHAITEKVRAEQDNQKFMRLGIRASARYVAALRSEADAHRAVKKAQQGVHDAQTISAQAKTVAMTKQLSKNERILLGVLRQIRDAFNQTFGPGIQSIIKGIAVALLIISQRIKPLRKAFTVLGDAIAGAIVFAVDQLTSPQMIAAFANFANTATQLITPLTNIFLSLFRIILNIANAALPLLVPLLTSVANSLNGLAGSTSNLAKMQIIIQGLVDNFLVWFNLFATSGQIVLEFFKIAAPFGKQLADSLLGAAKGMLAWLKSDTGRQQVQEFLAAAVPFAIRLAHFFAQIVVFLARLGEVIAPILGPLLDIFTATLNISSRLLRIVGLLSAALGKLFSFFSNLVVKILDKLGSFIDDFVQIGKDFIGGLLKGMLDKAKSLLDAAGNIGKKVLDKIKHPWKIFSPSKVTQGYGEQLVEGLKKGMEQSSKGLSMAIKAHITGPILDPLHAGVKAVPAASKAAAVAFGNSGGGNGDINIGDLILPAPPGGGLSDPRAHAVQLMTELRRSGRKGRR